MVGRNKFGRRRIVFGIVEVLNVIQAVISTVGQIYGLRIGLCVVDGSIQCNHQFFPASSCTCLSKYQTAVPAGIHPSAA